MKKMCMEKVIAVAAKIMQLAYIVNRSKCYYKNHTLVGNQFLKTNGKLMAAKTEKSLLFAAREMEKVRWRWIEETGLRKQRVSNWMKMAR